MINLDVFLMGLMAVSVLTGVATEALKKLLDAVNAKYQSNILSGLVALVLAVGVGVAYVVVMGLGFTPQIIVCLVFLVFASWLCAMIGYDKVVQVINQLKNVKKG